MIATFGCSQTGGFTEEPTWSKLLSNETEQDVYNIGHPATSLAFSVDQLIKFKKLYPQSKTILQITRPNRFTLIDGFDFSKYLKQDGNYYYLDKNQTGELLRTYIGADRMCNQYPYCEQDLKYYRETVTRHSKLDQLNFIANIYLAKSLADLVFFHQTPNHQLLQQDPKLSNILCLETILGSEFKTLSRDEAGHFTQQGMVWQSNHLKEYIKL